MKKGMAVRTKGLVATLALVLSGGVAAVWITATARAEEDTYVAAKHRYIAAVDAVCAAATVETIDEQAAPATTREEVTELTRAAQGMAHSVAEIEAIAPPYGDAERIRRGFLDPARRLSTDLRLLSDQAETALRANQPDKARELVERSLAPNAHELALRGFAEEYGFVACAGQ